MRLSRAAAPLIPALLVLAAAAAFLPVLKNGFVGWDDAKNFYENPYFRGLGRTQLAWMFLDSSHRFNYEPMTWLLYGLTYSVWGLKPFGYHLDGLLFHLATTVAFYFVALRLFKLAAPEPGAATADDRRWAAATAALFFSIHPLRVEVVTWASGQHYAFCGFFFVSSIWAYLRSLDVLEGEKDRRRWRAGSVLLHALSLSFISIGMTLPVILLILDVYPLKRLGARPSAWLEPESRGILWEKAPYFALTFAAAAAMVVMRARSGSIVAVSQFNFLQRAALSCYGIAFCFWKTLVPFHLLPLYELPIHFDPLTPAFLFSAFVVAALSLALFASRRVWPAGLAVWAYHIVTLSPVLGLVLVGPQMTADRYTYLPGLGWALLAGAGALAALRSPNRLARPALLILGFLALGLGILTRRQIGIWRDTETLWTYTLSVDPANVVGHNSLAFDLMARGQDAQALPHVQEALRLQPYFAQARVNLGVLLARQGRQDEAVAQFREALRIHPGFEDAISNLDVSAKNFDSLGLSLAGKGEFGASEEQYRKSLQILPDYAEAHYGLANVLSLQGRFGEAIGHYQEVLRTYPQNVALLDNMGVALLHQGNPAEAAVQFRKVLALAPNDPDARRNLDGAEKALRRSPAP